MIFALSLTVVITRPRQSCAISKSFGHTKYDQRAFGLHKVYRRLQAEMIASLIIHIKLELRNKAMNP
jgi:hypothetical protein